MDKVLEKKYRIKSFEVDFQNRLKISRLLNLLQEAAALHSYQLNASYNELKKQNDFWVLSRIYMEVNELPEWNDKITIRTWPKGIDKIFGLRDFEITNANSKKLIQVTSNWIIVNFKNYRPVRIQRAIDDFTYIEGKHAINKRLEKIEIPDKTKTSECKTARYSDIDINQHVNNSKYFEWLFDIIPLNLLKEHRIRSLEGNFLSEVKYNDSVVIRENKIDNSLYYQFHKNNKEVFRCHLSLQSNK